VKSVKLVTRRHRYYARYYDGSRPEGDRQCTRSLKTERKDVAERRVVERRKEFKEGRLNPWNPDDKSGELVTFQEAASRFLDSKSHLRPASVNEYRIALEGLDVTTNVLLRNVTAASLRRYVVRDRSVAVATRRKRHRHLKAFFRWAVREGYIDTSPLREVTPPKKKEKTPEYLTPNQLRRLLRCIAADYDMKVKNDRAQPGQVLWLLDLIRLAVNTGMRLGELTSLRFGAVDFREEFIEVLSTPEEPTKSGSERRVPMTEEARAVLERLHSEREGRGPGEHVLKGYNGGPLNGRYASQRFKHYVRKAGLDERFSFHSLRHTCASWLVQRGVSLPVVQAILGHADPSTTERYAHMAPDAVKQAISVLDEE
jgi:integrase